jgi:energy-coupling factor transporter ATP-binding protein EcfA2
VSIASQLVSCPKILFLDEPTSGLDSTASFEVISYAKKLAVANKVGVWYHEVSKYLLTMSIAHHYSKHPPAIHGDVSAIRQASSTFRRANLLLRTRGEH